MKGVILAGGTGSRLSPLTKVTNKHLLPIYNKPMIYYPLLKLKEMGVKSVLLVSGKGHAGHFLELLGAGTEFGLSIAYEVQEEAGGIAQALSLAKDFVGEEKFVVMLGDNIFEDSLTEAARAFESGNNEAHLFLKEVSRPESYGVPRFEDGKIVEILEKPSVPPSQYAVTGAYLYTPKVFEIIQEIQPSARGELEITTVNDFFVHNGSLSHTLLDGFWGDCGESIDQMMAVSRFIQENLAH
jgi:glucose-1-phosphate thymidylyltransferase